MTKQNISSEYNFSINSFKVPHVYLVPLLIMAISVENNPLGAVVHIDVVSCQFGCD